MLKGKKCEVRDMRGSLDSGMDLIGGDALALDVIINRAALFLIVAEGVEHLGERKVGQPHDDFFRRDAELPQLSDRPHRRSRSGDDRSAVENLVSTYNVRVVGGGRHAHDHW